MFSSGIFLAGVMICVGTVKITCDFLNLHYFQPAFCVFLSLQHKTPNFINCYQTFFQECNKTVLNIFSFEFGWLYFRRCMCTVYSKNFSLLRTNRSDIKIRFPLIDESGLTRFHFCIVISLTVANQVFTGVLYLK